MIVLLLCCDRNRAVVVAGHCTAFAGALPLFTQVPPCDRSQLYRFKRISSTAAPMSQPYSSNDAESRVAVGCGVVACGVGEKVVNVGGM